MAVQPNTGIVLDQGNEPQLKDKVTIVVFSGEMDKAIAAFNIATTAAAMGTEVCMFFTFWGLNVLKKDQVALRGKGIMRKMLNLMNRGAAEKLPLSKFNMFGMGPWMMKKLMKESRLPSVEEMLKLAKESGVKIVACNTTIGMMGLSKSDFVSDIDAFAGAAYFLGEAKEGKMTLFIS